MNDAQGSVWRKWDLHVHTPDSLVHQYEGENPWETFLNALESLPPEFKVIGINDYLFLDGYKRIIGERQKGRLANIDLFLPVVELRLDRFCGSNNHLSRVNYHVIFSNELSTETIEHQFINALSSKYVLSPQYSSVAGGWSGVPNRQGLEDLGRKIIGSVPESERPKFGTPLVEGFNNLCLSLESIQGLLDSPYFKGKAITAVGKTEWADIKWNNHSIADKKTIINSAHLVFISCSDPEHWQKAKTALTKSGVNDRLLDCSDAHAFVDANTKDRIGKCFTWIKADPTFEGLRQAVVEFEGRVIVSQDRPIEPLLCIRNVKLTFPDNTMLQSQNGLEDFCFAGEREVSFSPYLTCIVGGRGTGKSTLLNLLHEKLNPGGAKFFKDNWLVPEDGAVISTCVSIDNDWEEKEVEFLQQNEIEQFATDPSRFTNAILSRLMKRDEKELLVPIKTDIDSAIEEARNQAESLKNYHALMKGLGDAEKELVTKKTLIESFQNDGYRVINDQLAIVNKELEGLRGSKGRMESLLKDIKTVLAKHRPSQDTSTNVYEKKISAIIAAIEKATTSQSDKQEVVATEQREKQLAATVVELKVRLEGFLRERGLSQENLADVGKASERVAHLEGKLPSMKARISSIKEDLGAFTPQIDLAKTYAATLSDLLAPLNSELHSLSSEVKPISLRYEFDLNGFREAIIQNLKEQLSEEGRIRIDHVAQMLEVVDFCNLTTAEELLSKIRDNRETGRILREFFSKEPNFDVFKLEVVKELLDVDRHGRVRVSYDGKPLENTSFGQRCTAAIVILVLLGNTPIVIDEPEAHLDSALIAKYLVELVKRTKRHRQIIFATHNANFVVNGDAELVHALSMGTDKRTSITSTTIENLDHRGLLLALEGGKEAFQKRELRYGIE